MENGGQRASRLALGLAAATVLLHVGTSRGYGWFRDELYYVACGRHLALGYVDHPPLTPLLARLVTGTLGASVVALRLLPALAAGGTVLLTGSMVRELGGRPLAVAAAALAVMLGPVFLGMFGIFTTNAFDVLLWVLACFVLLRLLRTDDARLWVPFGAIVGIGLENKHTMAFLVAGVAVALLITPARRHLRKRFLWVGAGLAALVVLPNAIWEIRHGAPTLEFLRNAREYKNLARAPGAFLAEQVLVLNPLAAPLWIAGLGFFLFAREGARYRAIGWTYLSVLVLLVRGGGKAYYLAPLYPILFAAGAVALAERWPRPTAALAAAVVASGLALAPLAKPLLPVGSFVGYAAVFGQAAHAGVDERHETAALPQPFADQHGWPELAAAVAGVWAALPAADRARGCLVAGNYGEAGAIDLFGPALGLPPALSGHNSYWLWGRRGCELDPVVVLGYARADVAPFYREVEEAAVFTCAFCMPYEQRLPIWVARGRRVPAEELWARVRRYI